MRYKITEGKGKQGENCNVTACQEPKSAHYYNSAMRAWYCHSCAKKIEMSANRDGMSFFEDVSSKPYLKAMGLL